MVDTHESRLDRAVAAMERALTEAPTWTSGRTVPLDRPANCPTCHGTGTAPKEPTP